MINWTWHNPPGFEGDASYILQIDRLCIRRMARTVHVSLLVRLEALLHPGRYWQPALRERAAGAEVP